MVSRGADRATQPLSATGGHNNPPSQTSQSLEGRSQAHSKGATGPGPWGRPLQGHSRQDRTFPETQGRPGRDQTTTPRGLASRTQTTTDIFATGSKWIGGNVFHFKRKCETTRSQHIAGKNNCAQPASNYLPMLGYFPGTWVTRRPASIFSPQTQFWKASKFPL